MSVVKYFQTLGYVNCYDVSVPDNLREKKLMDSNYDLLLKGSKNDPYLKKLITGDKN